MARSVLFNAFLLLSVAATLSGRAQVSATTTTTVGGAAGSLALPDIRAFLPSADQLSAAGFVTFDQLLAKAGLPSWDKLGLPPASELLKPVGGPAGVSLPSPADMTARAGQVFGEVLDTMLPPNVQRAIKAVNATASAVGSRLPGAAIAGGLAARARNATLKAVVTTPLPVGLPKLAQLLVPLGIPGLNATTLRKLNATAIAAAWDKPLVLNIALPQNLPPLEDVLTAANRISAVLNALPSRDAMPSVTQLVGVLNAVTAIAQRVNADTAASGGGSSGGSGTALPSRDQFVSILNSLARMATAGSGSSSSSTTTTSG